MVLVTQSGQPFLATELLLTLTLLFGANEQVHGEYKFLAEANMFLSL